MSSVSSALLLLLLLLEVCLALCQWRGFVSRMRRAQLRWSVIAPVWIMACAGSTVGCNNCCLILSRWLPPFFMSGITFCPVDFFSFGCMRVPLPYYVQPLVRERCGSSAIC
ncbi:hypothetical protein F4819DRAFT_460495, partial [Hypoxylon fuscum]